MPITKNPHRYCALSLTLSLGLLPQAVTAQEETALNVAPVVVSATRTETSSSQVARSITVVEGQELADQVRVSRNVNDILAKTVPGLAPSTEAMSNFGQTLRGRKFLVLIDGIPQSTPLRDASRGLNSISPSAIERIEVVRGGTAVYGFGATGGVINIITKKADESELAGYSQVGVRASTTHHKSSEDIETEHRVSGTRGNLDYVLAGSYVERGGRFDADGKRIPPGGLGVQGGFADTEEYNVLAKTGLNFDGGRQRVELMFNDFRNVQDSNYTFGFNLEDGRTPAVRLNNASQDAIPGEEPSGENTNARISYKHGDLLGQEFNADLYYGDVRQVFPKFPSFNQLELLSEKLGARTTVNSPLAFIKPGATVTWGLDYLADETKPNSLDDDGQQVAPTAPVMDQDAVAGFAELEVPLGEAAVIRGGVRREFINVDTETVESNVNGNTVLGGRLKYRETLFNLGAVYFVSDSVDLFASFSQGFSIADLGRVLSDAGEFGANSTLNAEDFESDAEKVDNYEIGLRYFGDRVSASGAVFYSESDNGTTFDDDLRIQKFEEDIWGLEGTLDLRLTEQGSVGGTLSWTEGLQTQPDGERERLDGTRIPPLKATAYVGHQTADWWYNRLQLLHVGKRDQFPDAPGPSDGSGFGRGEVKRYTLVDYVARFDAGPGELSFSVKNLLNEDYFPAQSRAFNIPTAFNKGEGRSLGLGYALNW
ncbi:MAG: TonB-dependent receptor [Oleiphilaceae bacterium]|nr:TonB-dependent receptor [Oleiphilaceae bacterium]